MKCLQIVIYQGDLLWDYFTIDTRTTHIDEYLYLQIVFTLNKYLITALWRVLIEQT